MAVKDPDIFKIVEKIGDHYHTNLNNRFVRKAIMIVELPQSEWDRLDNLTTKSDYYKAQGFQFDELYEMILAAAHFIYQARQKVVPSIRTLVAQPGAQKIAGTIAPRAIPPGLTRNFTARFILTCQASRRRNAARSRIFVRGAAEICQRCTREDCGRRGTM